MSLKWAQSALSENILTYICEWSLNLLMSILKISALNIFSEE